MRNGWLEISEKPSFWSLPWLSLSRHIRDYLRILPEKWMHEWQIMKYEEPDIVVQENDFLVYCSYIRGIDGGFLPVTFFLWPG